MIFGNLNNLGSLKKYPKEIQKILLFFRDNNPKLFENGDYKEDNFNFFVKNLKTQKIENSIAESHKKFIDIHILIEGQEKIGFCVLNDNLEITDENDEKDFILYKKLNFEQYITLHENDFVIFFQEDIHRPVLEVEKEENIKKIIVKLAIF